MLVGDPKMDDTEARAERVRAIAEGPGFGRVVERNGDVMTVEVAADTARGLAVLWGDGGFSTTFVGRRTRLSHIRVIDMNGSTIVNHQMVTTAFYRYTIDLTVDTRTGKAQPCAASW